MVDTKEVFLLWFIGFLYKKTSGGAIKSISSQQLADELHKPIIRKFN